MGAPAPPYRDEGPHARWHVSEDPALARFTPHRAHRRAARVGHRHAPPPLYWLPRDWPRCTFWAGKRATAADVERLLDGDRTARVHVIEDGWADRVATAELQLYRMPEATFVESTDTAGYWMSREPVDALERVTIGDLVGRHSAAGIALRTLPELWSLWDAVVWSTLEFSGMRLRNASPRR